MVVSIPLLSAVLDDEVFRICEVKENYLHYKIPDLLDESKEDDSTLSINIYELQQAMIDFAFAEGYSFYIKVRSDFMNYLDVTHFYAVQIGIGSDKHALQFRDNSMPQAVCDACEYILKERDKSK